MRRNIKQVIKIFFFFTFIQALEIEIKTVLLNF